MAAYIKSGVMAKMLLAPNTPVQSSEVLSLEAKAISLREELDNLRGSLSWDDIPHEVSRKSSPKYDRVRYLRRELSKIDAQVGLLMKKDNPEWFKYWGV